jgi:hypothetical protein
VQQCDGSIPITRDIVTHVDDPTLIPRPLREALARADAAPLCLVALGIPLCPACELLTASLAQIGRSRPDLTIEIALLSSPAEWADREVLLWPRGIHVSRSSVPVLVLLRAGELIASRPGGGPASAIDAWLTTFLGPPAASVEETISAPEATRLAELGDLRRRHLTVRGRATVD